MSIYVCLECLLTVLPAASLAALFVLTFLVFGRLDRLPDARTRFEPRSAEQTPSLPRPSASRPPSFS